MIQEEISEGNKLIAEFMEWTWETDIYKPGYWWSKDPLKDRRMFAELFFHESWDWIMPVYVKIMDNLQHLDRPSKNHCCKGDEIEVDIFCHLRVADIHKMWQHVVLFIKWWNSRITPTNKH